MNSTSSMLDIINSIKNNDYEEKKKLQEQLKVAESKIRMIKQWVENNTQADGCIDCSAYETDELLKILNS